jgi:hypothetical protein
MKLTTVCFFAFLSCAAGAAEQDQARLKQEPVFLKRPEVAANNLQDCQPLAGEVVKILEYKKADFVEFARVEVQAGRCAKQQGWVGVPQLEVVR